MKIESSVRQIPHSQQAVYDTLGDLTHLQSLKDKIGDAPTGDARLDGVRDKIKDLVLDRDSMSVTVSPIGQVTMRIVEREEPKMIKFESDKSPLAFKFWIQVLPVEAVSSKIRLTIDADVPFFAKAMVEKPLKEAIEKIAEMLSVIPYGE